ncbi:CDP-glucose 4,6-dehydratase, partial [Candidatus Pelagibacter sp.]|nr:CDP-glucose 4,6-dehydratase [Candidatus Pelagibacter sp.]
MKNKKNFWKKKKVFITGHTGFKGSWLLLTLHELGSTIAGYSLPPVKDGIFNNLNLKKKLKFNYYHNILNKKILEKSILKFKPDIIFHLAAQPLVIESYINPYNNFNTNTLGTLNLLETIRKLNYQGTAIIITTDKVYNTKKTKTSFKEEDEIGVSDPYGSSKVASEIITQSYAKSFLNKDKFNLLIARSGNVIGGGDFSANRIIPDYYKSVNGSKKLQIRNPDHIRPWQHVMEPINGYILLAQKYYKKNISNGVCWNFGPQLKDSINVKKLINILNNISTTKVKIFFNNKKKSKLSETEKLMLNSNKSKKILKWQQKFNINQT